jgi:hypothetical protein
MAAGIAGEVYKRLAQRNFFAGNREITPNSLVSTQVCCGSSLQARADAARSSKPASASRLVVRKKRAAVDRRLHRGRIRSELRHQPPH